MSSFVYIKDSILTGNTKANNIHTILFKLMVDCDTKTKFKFFYDTLNNMFLDTVTKTEFEILFCRIQKIYSAFRKFAYVYRFKKSNIIVDTDLCGNSLTLNNRNVFCLFNENNRYLFTINDLIKLINTSLTNEFLFILVPLNVKNPYNNVILNKSTLYNIYFFIKYNTHLYPELIFKYFKCNFNSPQFLKSYTYLLREYSIESHIKNSSKELKQEEIHDMIFHFNKRTVNTRFHIHDEFPCDILISVMKPYHRFWLYYAYSLIPSTKIICNKKFMFGLSELIKFNPLFGRMCITYGSTFHSTKPKRIIEFNDRHLPFVNNNDKFMKSHEV